MNIEALGQLQRIQGVQGAAVLRRNGDVVQSSFGHGTEGEVTGALAAAVFGLIGQSIEHLDIGGLSNCMFEGNTGAVYMLGTGEHVLLVVTAKQANMGLIRLGLQRAATSLRS